VLENHSKQCDVVARAAAGIVGEDGVLTAPAPKMGSEDFADMLQAVPGAYFWLGHAGSVPVHNPGFVLDDGILPVGASIFARIIETRMPCQ
jgi:hippurate hydrolase